MLKENLGLKKEHIVHFLHQFTQMDYTDPSVIANQSADWCGNPPVYLECLKS